MVSDEQIVKRIGEILATADLTVTSTSTIRKQLEQELEIDLSCRKAFVREQIDLYLDSHPHTQGEDEEAQQGEDADAAAEEKAAQREKEETKGDEYEDEEEEEEEERVENKPEEDSKRFKAKLDRVKRESLQKEKKKRGATGGGYTKLCKLSPELAAVMGEKEMARTQVVKSLWVYIRAHNLQDPGNKRKILCDDRLEAVFGTKTTDIFKMNKVLTKHLWPLDCLADGEVRRKRPKPEPEEDEGNSKSKKLNSEKKEAPDKEIKKGKGAGFTAPLHLSETLQEFFGTGESELPRSEVVKRMWEYIKKNNLQNPSDKRQILCDSKLKKIFGCDSFVGFSMTKHLTSHLSKIENAE